MGDDFLSSYDPDENYFNELFGELNDSSHSRYLSISEYNSLTQEHKLFMKVLGYNIRSFNANFDSFSCLMNHENLPEVLVLSETWFYARTTVGIPNYVSHHTVRENGHSGGVSVFIGQKFHSEQLLEYSFCTENIEICTVKFSAYGETYYIIGVYRPITTGSIENFQLAIESVFDRLNTNGKNCFVVGDMNINLLNEDDIQVLSFKSFMHTCHFIPVISNPTRFSPISNHASLLDHIWINKPTFYISGIINCDITDHLPTFIFIPAARKLNDSHKIKITFRLTNDENKLKFFQCIDNYDWNMIRDSDPDVFMSGFITELNKMYCSNFPLKTKFVSARNCLNPWVTSQIRKLIQTRANFFKWSKLELIERREYNRIRNKIKSIIDKSRTYYFNRLFAQNSNNLSKTWELIKQLSHSGTNRNSSIEKIITNNIEYTSNFDIAEEFSKYFSKVADELRNHIPPTSTNPMSFIRPNNSNSMILTPVTTHECETLIKNVKNTKSSTNEIPIILIKEISAKIAPCLCEIINLSFLTGVFPDCLKCATIIPIFKIGNRCEVKNYRPISLLPVFAKIMEKCLFTRLSNYFQENLVLSPCQFGFSPGYSTESAATKITEYLYTGLNARKYSLTVLIDFRKAFDTVDHSILLAKLEAYGVTGPALRILENYLCNRSQVVRIGNCLSSPKRLEVGVPQGSCLGPLLFLIYVNDLPNFSDLAFTVLYADDTTISFQNSNLDTLFSIVNCELTKFSEWTACNRLSINTDKTSTFLVTNRILPEILPSAYINGVSLQSDCVIKYLGILIDNKLKFNNHIQSICSKVSRSIGVMSKLKKFLNFSTMRSLYHSLVYSYLIYCNLCWGNTFQSHLQPLKVLQKRAIRVINGLGSRAHTSEYFHSNKLLKLSDINFYRQAQYVYLNPSQFGSSSHNYDTRNSSQLIPMFNRITLTQNSLTYSAPHVWNSLPDQIREAQSEAEFKNKIFNFLLSNYI